MMKYKYMVHKDCKSQLIDYFACFCCVGAMRPKLRQFAPLLVALVGLPGRGKSLLAKRLARYLNFIGETTKGNLYLLNFRVKLIIISICFVIFMFRK